MNNMIKNYVSKMSKEQVSSFALMHNIILRPEELDFTYNFIKEHYEDILKNSFNLDLYKEHYTEDNFNKIKALFNEYSNKYKPFLH